MLKSAKVIKVSRYRTLANNALALAHRNCFPIATNMSFDAKALMALARERGVSTNGLLTKVIADTMVEDAMFAPLNSLYQRNYLIGDRMVFYPHVSFTLALDRFYEGERVACVYVLENVDQRSLVEVDQELKQVQELEVPQLPIFKKLRFILGMPSVLQRILFFVSSLLARPGNVTFGTVGLTNLGKGAIEEVFPISPKTIIFGIGGAQNQVVMGADGSMSVRPMMKINMTFNHFAVDGMICNLYLTRLKHNLEQVHSRY